MRTLLQFGLDEVAQMLSVDGLSDELCHDGFHHDAHIFQALGAGFLDRSINNTTDVLRG